MPSQLRAVLVVAAVGLVTIDAIPAAMAGSDVGQPAQIDAATPTTTLLQLCRDSGEASMEAGPEVDPILQRHEQARVACDRLIDSSGLEGRDLAKVLLDRADLDAPGQGDAYARALADYDRAIALVPDLATAYWRRGKANLLYGRTFGSPARPQ
ncbi:hypothetical protein AJ87_47365 [Rhizobium yanglingense]|nr:hypothetical protein AJ87_47365 [Rhizobium yanglingense]